MTINERGLLRRAAAGLADWVWPPECPLSGERVSESGHLSSEAWSQLSFLAAPCCRQCGLPFPYAGGSKSDDPFICATCIAKPPRFGRARAPLAYCDQTKRLVLSLKSASRFDMLDRYARWMVMAGRPLLDDADDLVPVPLHWRRLFDRRFNQSALLARAVGRHVPVRVTSDVLLRRKPTPSQAGKSARGRRRNMAGAFHVAHPEKIAGRHLVIIDDVFTTGATVNACTRVLLRAGAARVDVLTLCRVVRETDVTI